MNDAVVIDGRTEPDFAGAPVVELNGAGAGGTVSGLTFTAGNSEVRGLVVNRFSLERNRHLHGRRERRRRQLHRH